MPIFGKEKIDEQHKEELDGIARISLDIRIAVILILNVRRTSPMTGTTRATPKPSYPCVQLTGAILCGDMFTLGGAQLGPTGRSVAQRYSATLRKRCPTGVAPLWSYVAYLMRRAQDLPSEALMREGSQPTRRGATKQRWKRLPLKVSEHPMMTHIDLYKKKRTDYTDSRGRSRPSMMLSIESGPAVATPPSLSKMGLTTDGFRRTRRHTATTSELPTWIGSLRK